jgi:hypothetical protein
MVTTPHYLLLDTKNFLTRPVDADVLFRGDKAISFQWKCPPAMAPFLAATAKAFGCEARADEWAMPTATPYVMVTDAVREIVAERASFVATFYGNSKITEFFSYFYHLKNTGRIHDHYEFVPQFYATFFAQYPSEPRQMEAVQRGVESPNVFSVSFHRERFRACAPAFHDYIAQLWLEHELVRSRQDADEVIQAMAGH